MYVGVCMLVMDEVLVCLSVGGCKSEFLSFLFSAQESANTPQKKMKKWFFFFFRGSG